jgi:superfamily II DNA or RNA helicase
MMADAEGVRLSFRDVSADVNRQETWPQRTLMSLSESALLTDMALLLDQGLAVPDAGSLLVSASDWPHAVTLGIAGLTAYTAPSHLLLQVDRESELGRADFRYILRWLEGGRDIAVERLGPYVRHVGTGRVMHLDPRTATLVEAMERYNSLHPEERTKARAFADFATVRYEAAATGALLDEYLASNTVVIPGTIGLTIRQNDDGSISFEPRVPDLPDPDQFVTQFNRSTSVPDVDTLTMPDGRRVRVLFSEVQREVLRRMQRVRRLKGDDAKQVRTDPASVFDGVADAIDLSDVRLEYGPRVIGVGPLSLPSEIRPESAVTMTGLLGLDEHDDGEPPDGPPPLDVPLSPDATEASPTPSPPAPAPRRVAIAIDLIDAETNAPATIRFDSEDGIRQFGTRVDKAISGGADTVSHEERRYRVEPALQQVIEAHLSDTTAPAGAVGRNGHLYLLIDEHESTLTDALRVTDGAGNDVSELPPPIPASLRAGTTLQPHQLDGIRWLAATRATDGRRGGILADDMGLGKTLQLLTHVAHLIETGVLEESSGQGANGPWRPVLIIAPLLLVDNGTWTEEMKTRFDADGRIFEPWLVLRDEGLRKVRANAGEPDLLGKPLLDPAKLMRHKVVITTYETLMAYQHSLAQRVGGRPLWSLVIFDEAQKVKSVKTKNSYVAKAVDAAYKIAATGTPVETRMLDLWSLLDTVEPTRFGTQRDFVATYERPAMNSGNPGQRHAALQALRSALQYQRPGAYLLRRDKTVLSGLPAKTEHRPRCTMTDVERTVSASIRAAMRKGSSTTRALAGLQQLHLASQHPFLAQGRDTSRYNSATLLSASSRLQQLISLLDEIESRGEKVLIFARSVPAQKMLAQVIGEHFRSRIDIVNGEAVPGRSGPAGSRDYRRRTFERFRSEPGFAAIVLSPFVAGVGLTLVEANHVIHYGRWWNPAVENQATDRVYRIGQTRPVHVYYPIAFDPTGAIDRTFDEALDELMTTRRSLATDFLIPVPDGDAEGQLLSSLLGDDSTQPSEAPQDATIDSSEDVARLLVATVRASGETAHWLGTERRFGADAIVQVSGTPAVIVLAERYDRDVEARAAAAVASWRRHIPTVAATPLVRCRERRDHDGQAVGSWDGICNEAKAHGITIDDARLDVTPTDDVEAIIRTFG